MKIRVEYENIKEVEPDMIIEFKTIEDDSKRKPVTIIQGKKKMMFDEMEISYLMESFEMLRSAKLI